MHPENCVAKLKNMHTVIRKGISVTAEVSTVCCYGSFMCVLAGCFTSVHLLLSFQELKYNVQRKPKKPSCFISADLSQHVKC